MSRRRKSKNVKATAARPAPVPLPPTVVMLPSYDRSDVERLESTRADLEAERTDLDRRAAEADAERAAAEHTIETSTDPDRIQSAQAALPRLDAELRAIANRRPQVQDELLKLGAPIQAAMRAADRRGMAATLVAIGPGIAELRDVLAAVDVLRSQAVSGGAPASAGPGGHGALGGDSSKMLDALDRLRLLLDEAWPLELEDAHDVLQGVERQRFSQVASIDRDLRAHAGRQRAHAGRWIAPVSRPSAPVNLDSTVTLSTGRTIRITGEDRTAVEGMALVDAFRTVLERRAATSDGEASPVDPDAVIRYLLDDDLRALAHALGSPAPSAGPPDEVVGPTGYSPADVGRSA